MTNPPAKCQTAASSTLTRQIQPDVTGNPPLNGVASWEPTGEPSPAGAGRLRAY